ncbi:hypothetical protein AMTR_s00114p00067440 [Amborella trichopoda]|uniref:Uncharacterized protein n=1 Tax=Amborella trichopoda TaxID=13333 RepID=W1NTQ4_AMBTC|nr:hypothetical protein AMTR_s00114p00067440 [Amborella trichopoda]
MVWVTRQGASGRRSRVRTRMRLRVQTQAKEGHEEEEDGREENKKPGPPLGAGPNLAINKKGEMEKRAKSIGHALRHSSGPWV